MSEDQPYDAAEREMDLYRAEIARITARLRETAASNIRLRELLGDIGVKAANAPEDGDSFGLLEEIAMMIAAHDVDDSETGQAGTGDTP